MSLQGDRNQKLLWKHTTPQHMNNRSDLIEPPRISYPNKRHKGGNIVLNSAVPETIEKCMIFFPGLFTRDSSIG